jgi:hypothetical protein
MSQAELEDCASPEYLRLGAVVEIGAQRLPSFINTNREGLKPPPGLVTTFGREPVVQSWLSTALQLLAPTLLGAYS